uniref:Uncharacterized protein n=1 Tax=Haptolina brevifila TaxID=156173 RepID=A0A7S2H2I0_9EUKA|mmetsp:Transcript_50540/g.100573  ORF Transcript_50540/g.100573 Transcript_50540/m.100573 type:complete len:230 (+) Transcript_50540:355-1044(+)
MRMQSTNAQELARLRSEGQMYGLKGAAPTIMKAVKPATSSKGSLKPTEEAYARARSVSDHDDDPEEVRRQLIAVMKDVSRDHLDNAARLKSCIKDIEAACFTIHQKNQFTLFKTQKALTMLLLKQYESIAKMRHEGILDHLDASPLLTNINRKIGGLTLENYYDHVSPLRANKRKQMRQQELIAENQRNSQAARRSSNTQAARRSQTARTNQVAPASQEASAVPPAAPG